MNELKFDENSLVFIDEALNKRGVIQLKKLLETNNIEWCNRPDDAITHIISNRWSFKPHYVELINNPEWKTRADPDDIKKYKEFKLNDTYWDECYGDYYSYSNGHSRTDLMSNGVCKFIQLNFEGIAHMKCYKLSHITYILERLSNGPLPEPDVLNVLSMLKSGIDANVSLAVTLMDNYIFEEKLHPYLLLNGKNQDVRKYLRLNGITKFHTDGHSQLMDKEYDKLRDQFFYKYSVPDNDRLEFLKYIIESRK